MKHLVRKTVYRGHNPKVCNIFIAGRRGFKKKRVRMVQEELEGCSLLNTKRRDNFKK
jgi:hypothetical protein